MEMAAPSSSTPGTVVEIYRDYAARRAGLIRALTTDVDEFHSICDPRRQNLCLYGLPNGNWMVTVPSVEVPPGLPKPTLGINFARDAMKRCDWLSQVAVHSDAWLISIAYFSGAHLNGNERKSLFDLINVHPSLRETMINYDPSMYGTMVDQKQRENKSVVDNSGKSRHSTKLSGGKMENSRLAAVEDGYEDNKERSETLCGTCSGLFNSSKFSEFWIGCDSCERWFHGSCVKITLAEAKQIKYYKCPDCSKKSSGQ